MLLVRTPAPHANESPAGYLVRLANENAISGVRKILSLIGFKSRFVMTVGWNFGRLAMILGPDVLPDKFGYSHERNARGQVSVQGHRVASEHIGFDRARLCPECLKEHGYVLAEWDLKACVACHKHKCMMLKNCTRCGERIKVIRPNLFTCRCGADFREAKTVPASDELVGVMELLHAKIVQDRRGLNCALTLKFPCDEIMSTDVDVFCKILVQLTVVHLQMTLGLRPRGRDLRIAVHLPKTALVFSDWPQRFQDLCGEWRAFCDREPEKVKNVPKWIFQGFYGWIFVRLYKNLRDRSIQTLFLAKAALEYGIQTWDRSPIQLRGRTVKSLDLPNPNFVSVNRAAQIFGIRPMLMQIRVAKGHFPARRLSGATSRPRWVVDVAKFREGNYSRYSGIGGLRGGRILCMSRALCLALWRFGEIPSTRVAFGNSRLAAEDVFAYRKIILEVAIRAKGSKKLYPLRDLLWSLISNEEKVQVLRNVRQGDMKVYFKKRRRSFRDLYLGEDVVSKIRENLKKAIGKNCIGAGVIAKRFGLSATEASALVCYLAPEGKAERLATATLRNVEGFLEKFVPLRWYAQKAEVAPSVMYSAVQSHGLSNCLLELPPVRRLSAPKRRAIFANRALLALEERKFNVPKGAFLQVHCESQE